MTRELLPDFVRHLTEEAQLASFAKLARLAALALDYRTAHGSFPSDASSVQGAEALTDPLTDKPFLVGRKEGVLVLQSPGDPAIVWRLDD